MSTKAERIAKLEAIRDKLYEKLDEALERAKPDYELDDQAFDWGSYIDSLWQQIERIDAAISRQLGREITWLGKTKRVVPDVTVY